MIEKNGRNSGAELQQDAPRSTRHRCYASASKAGAVLRLRNISGHDPSRRNASPMPAPFGFFFHAGRGAECPLQSGIAPGTVAAR
jgi:hypothetical protein